MVSALYFVRDIFLTLSILISMVFAPLSATSYEAKTPDKAGLVFNAVADVHVETNNPNSYENFKNVLSGLKANKSADANVFLGDNTMNGQTLENLFFFGGLNAMLKNENPLVVLGNHDIGNGEGDYNKLIKRYTNCNNLFLKNDIDKPYYFRIVNGCYMIFVASEELCVHSFFMSDEQIEWFKATLEEAGKSGKTIFVFSHHPLDYIENENEDILIDMLNKYDNVFHIHGHTHGDYTVYNEGRVVCVNLPRVTETVDYAPGTGITVEIYKDEIILRERDFCKGEWLSEISFPILFERVNT